MFAFLLYLTALLIIIKTYSLEQNTFIANRFIKVTTLLSGFFTMSAADWEHLLQNMGLLIL